MTTQYWITGTSGDWSTAADWQLGVVPGSTDDAVSNNSNSVTVNATAVAHSLTLDNSLLTVSTSSARARSWCQPMRRQGNESPRPCGQFAPACSKGRVSNAPDDHGACPHMNSTRLSALPFGFRAKRARDASSGVGVQLVKVDCGVSLRASKFNNEL